MKKMAGLIILTLLAVGAMGTALAAEDVFVIEDVAAASSGAWDEDYIASSLTTDRSYVRLNASLDGEASVNISVTDERGNLIYQRDYGVCSGTFRSEDVYLKLNGGQTTYQMTMTAGEEVFSFPVRRVMPRLRDNEACSVGYPLSSMSGANTWKSATLLDLAYMDGMDMAVSMHASNAYELGTVTFSVVDGQLSVSAELDGDIDGSIDGATVYVATSALEAKALGSKSFSGIKSKLNTPISLNGAEYAAVYVKLTVSFDPANVPDSPEILLDGQEDIWQQMLTETATEAVG